MTLDALLELKRSRDADLAFVREHSNEFGLWRGRLTQAEVAETLAVPQPYIARFELGDIAGIGKDALHKLVDLYRKLKEMSDAS